jgi:ubiquinone/menaquinone biosynthesis C-methylase UbiE
MKFKFLKLLCCPICEIISGKLHCRSCHKTYYIKKGVPIVLSKFSGTIEPVKIAFSDQWKLRKRGLFEEKELYGRTEKEEVGEFEEAFGKSIKFYNNLRIIDAGCGSGRLLKNLASKYKNCTFVGLDISDHCGVVYKSLKGLKNVLIVQGDLLNPPFQDKLFDLVWSQGVIIALPSTHEGFRSLSRLLKIKGQLYVWVYPSYIMTPYRLIRDILIVPYLFSEKLNYFLSWIFAFPVFLLYWTLIVFHVLGPRYKYSLRSLVFKIHDSLIPKYQNYHSKEEVKEWFEKENFKKTRILDDLGIVGIRT